MAACLLKSDGHTVCQTDEHWGLSPAHLGTKLTSNGAFETALPASSQQKTWGVSQHQGWVLQEDGCRRRMGARFEFGEAAGDAAKSAPINTTCLEGQPTPSYLWLKKTSAFEAHLNSSSQSCHLIYQVTAVF